MKKLLFLSAALLISAFVFNACKKSDDAKAEEMLVMTSEDVATHEDFSEQIDLDADGAIEERGGGGSGCPTVTFAQPQGTWPNTITIDFGDYCERPDGRVLKGVIIIEQSAAMFTAGAVRTLNFDNFFVDEVQVEGSKSWTNNGLNDDGQWSYTKTATDMVLSYPDGTTSTWSHNHTSTLIAGGDTPTHFDNVWSTVGNTSGTNRQGDAFTATITEPLIKRALCRWISEGVIAFTRGDRSATLDFGNGTCDRFGTLTMDNGNTVTIRLRR
jgi:hypothetical protein